MMKAWSTCPQGCGIGSVSREAGGRGTIASRTVEKWSDEPS